MPTEGADPEWSKGKENPLTATEAAAEAEAEGKRGDEEAEMEFSNFKRDPPKRINPASQTRESMKKKKKSTTKVAKTMPEKVSLKQ